MKNFKKGLIRHNYNNVHWVNCSSWKMEMQIYLIDVYINKNSRMKFVKNPKIKILKCNLDVLSLKLLLNQSLYFQNLQYTPLTIIMMPIFLFRHFQEKKIPLLLGL